MINSSFALRASNQLADRMGAVAGNRLKQLEAEAARNGWFELETRAADRRVPIRKWRYAAGEHTKTSTNTKKNFQILQNGRTALGESSSCASEISLENRSLRVSLQESLQESRFTSLASGISPEMTTTDTITSVESQRPLSVCGDLRSAC